MCKSIHALLDEGDSWCVSEGRQEEATALDGVADGGDTGALELIIIF